MPLRWLGLTGLHMAPSVNSKVVICMDHPFMDPWMREEGLFGVVLSVQPKETGTACDKNGLAIFGKELADWPQSLFQISSGSCRAHD